MLIAKHTLRLTNFTFVVGLTKFFSQILDLIDLLLRFFFGFKKVNILLKWLYSSLFQLGLRLGCSNFYFKHQNRKNKIKNIIIIFFFWGSIQGVHLNPLGSKWSRPWLWGISFLFAKVYVSNAHPHPTYFIFQWQ